MTDSPDPSPGPAHGTSAWATGAVCIDAVATAGSALLITSIAMLTTNVAEPPPLAFFLVMGGVIGWMLLRTLALTLVRLGLAWARWLYLVVVPSGAACLLALVPDLPVTGILLVAAVLPLIFVFLPSTSRWLQRKAWLRRRRRGLV